MAQEGYSHPEFLVDAEWVDAHKDDANVVIVDLRAGFYGDWWDFPGDQWR